MRGLPCDRGASLAWTEPVPTQAHAAIEWNVSLPLEVVPVIQLADSSGGNSSGAATGRQLGSAPASWGPSSQQGGQQAQQGAYVAADVATPVPPQQQQLAEQAAEL